MKTLTLSFMTLLSGCQFGACKFSGGTISGNAAAYGVVMEGLTITATRGDEVVETTADADGRFTLELTEGEGKWTITTSERWAEAHTGCCGFEECQRLKVAGCGDASDLRIEAHECYTLE